MNATQEMGLFSLLRSPSGFTVSEPLRVAGSSIYGCLKSSTGGSMMGPVAFVTAAVSGSTGSRCLSALVTAGDEKISLADALLPRDTTHPPCHHGHDQLAFSGSMRMWRDKTAKVRRHTDNSEASTSSAGSRAAKTAKDENLVMATCFL